MSLDERIEQIYHGMRCGAAVNLRDMRSLVAPVRSEMFDALYDRDYKRVEAAADRILELDPKDSVARLAKATALDGQGYHRQADAYFDSVYELDRRFAWVGIGLAKSKIRTRDLESAEYLLSQLHYRFGKSAQLDVVWAQLYEARGKLAEAVAKCEAVFNDPYCNPRDAFVACLLLRDLNRTELIPVGFERHRNRFEQNEGLLRLYGHACVASNYAPDEGLKILSELWEASPEDGRVIADYASALATIGRTRGAEELFKKGLKQCRYARSGRITLLEEYASFLDRQGRFSESHDKYRELLNSRQHDLHLYRHFASSLLRAASEAKKARDRAAEDIYVQEVKQVLAKLLQIAPEDQWASSALADAEARRYP